MELSRKLLFALGYAAALLVLLVLLVAPLEVGMALMVALVCAVTGCGILLLIEDDEDRQTATRLFLTAFGLRMAITFIAYPTGIIDYLGGNDDTGWHGAWSHSRFWRGWFGDPHLANQLMAHNRFPNTVMDLFAGGGEHNMGYHLLATYFFYAIDIRSQIALAALNCFISALTVAVIYLAARLFYSARAGRFVSWVAVFMPSSLAWSMLTIKEPTVIALEITAFYVVWLVCRRERYALLVPMLLLIVASMTFRFYVSYILAAACLVTLLLSRSRKPFQGALIAGVGLLLIFVTAKSVGALHFDLASLAQQRYQEAQSFRTAVAHGAAGSKTGVDLGYDPRTVSGGSAMIAVGAAYLLFSPFPWQFHSAKELVALPDVLLWWWMVFFYIVPGIRAAWRSRPNLLLSVILFVMPLILLYSILFGNVGLAYRQRAQLMPFLLILAAAGYDEKNRSRDKVKKWSWLRRGDDPLAVGGVVGAPLAAGAPLVAEAPLGG